MSRAWGRSVASEEGNARVRASGSDEILTNGFDFYLSEVLGAYAEEENPLWADKHPDWSGKRDTGNAAVETLFGREPTHVPLLDRVFRLEYDVVLPAI